MAELDEEEAAKLHREKGISYGELAKLTGMSKGGVYKRVSPVVDEMGGEPSEEEPASASEREKEVEKSRTSADVSDTLYKWAAVGLILLGLVILALAL